jgi:hemolysin D
MADLSRLVARSLDKSRTSANQFLRGPGALEALLKQRSWIASKTQSSDRDFLPAAIEILERPPNPLGAKIVMLICLLFAAALGWSYFGQVDIVASAQGVIRPKGGTKGIQSLETGKVASIDARNGQFVTSGQPLVELDVQEAGADLERVTALARSYAAEVARRRTEIKVARDVQQYLEEARAGGQEASSSNLKDVLRASFSETKDRKGSEAVAEELAGALGAIDWPNNANPQIIVREQQIFEADMEQLHSLLVDFEAQLDDKNIEMKSDEGLIAAQRRLVATLQTRVDMRTRLMAVQAGSKADLIDATQTLEQEQKTLSQESGRKAQAQSAALVIRAGMFRALTTFLSDDAQKLGEAERQSESYQQEVAKVTAQIANATLRSPIDGTVQSSVLTAAGQVLTAGDLVMKIVPKNPTLEIECYVPNREIGFIREGQSAAVKVEAFPFNRYGALDAVVVRVARDSIPVPDAAQVEGMVTRTSSGPLEGAQAVQGLVFPVTLKINRSLKGLEGAEAALSPGMAVNVEIATGRRRIIDYILAPLTETLSETMRGR